MKSKVLENIEENMPAIIITDGRSYENLFPTEKFSDQFFFPPPFVVKIFFFSLAVFVSVERKQKCAFSSRGATLCQEKREGKKTDFLSV